MVASTSLVKRDDGATLAQANNGAITTTSTALSDTNMQLCYLASELGEALTVEAAVTTVGAASSPSMARPYYRPAPLTAAKAHCVSIDKTITSAP